MGITLRSAVAADAESIGAVFDAAVQSAAGYQPDGSDRVSDFRGTGLRELRLVKRLLS